MEVLACDAREAVVDRCYFARGGCMEVISHYFRRHAQSDAVATDLLMAGLRRNRSIGRTRRSLFSPFFDLHLKGNSHENS